MSVKNGVNVVAWRVLHGQNEEPNVMTFRVPGRPVPMSRPRLSKGRVYLPDKDVRAKANIRAAISAIWGIDRYAIYKDLPLYVSCDFVYCGKPERLGAPYRSRPDVDNLLKTVLDALTGVIYDDDSQVVCVTGRKLYGAEDMTKIRVEWLTDETLH